MKSIYSKETEVLCDWLRQQLEHKNLTMREAAKLIGKPHSFIGKIESGQRRLDVVEYIWYCQKLGLNPNEGINLIVSVKRR
jgi:transcriptional regulator with XRE-family HTH domain